jgi:uncharacterized protein involved in type VI secretion and phage assembly
MKLSQAYDITINLVRTMTHQVFDVLDLSFTTRIHEDYTIIVEVVSSDSARNALSAKRGLVVGEWYGVEVCFHQHQKLMYLQGVCTELVATGRYANDSELQVLTLRSEFFPLFNNQRAGIYYGGSINDVIDRGLINLTREYHLNLHTDIEKKLMQNLSVAYPAQLSLTQYFEADMAFVLRLLRQSGVWFNFYHPVVLANQFKSGSSEKVKVIIGDHNAVLMRCPDKIKILKKTESQLDGFYDIEYTQAGTAIGEVAGVYYDEIMGEMLTCSAKIPGGQGYRVLKYILPQTVLTEAQMQYQTQVVADSLSLRQQILSGSFQGLFIQAGVVIELEGEHHIAGEYILSEVQYHFSKKANGEHVGLYQQNHRFKSYPLKVNYHEAVVDDQGQEPKLYRARKYQGVMPGVFALTQGSQTVVPDNLGSIPLWFPYNYWYTCQGQTCRYTRVISHANQGGRAGVSFPFYQDTEFILMFVNGDLDRPLIKGTAANNLTGHLHDQGVQKRSALALPQGQHLLYSNVSGDQNFLKWGATHNEGSDETHMLLSNYPNPELPGVGKMDYQQASTQSYERVVNSNSCSKAGCVDTT